MATTEWSNEIPPVTVEVLREEFPRIQKTQTLGEIKDDLDRRLSFIQEKLQDPAITQSDRNFYESYLQELSRMNIPDLSGDTKKSLQALLQIAKRPTVVEDNLQASIKTQLEKELSSLDGPIDKMTPDALDGMLSVTHKILHPSWLEKMPWIRDKMNEIRQYDPMIQGFTGATIIRKLQKLGYSIHFTTPNQIKVISSQPDARDIETKLNLHLAVSPVLSWALQSGLLYTSSSFESYRKSVTNEKGEFIDPSKVSLPEYIKYVNRKQLRDRDLSEKAFLISARNLENNINVFQKSLLQYKDYPKFIANVAEITEDKDVRDLLPKTKENSGNDVPPNSLAGLAGKWIGQVGWIIGKVAGAGAWGGMRVLGEAISEAYKHGGGWGVLAIIGGLWWSIFSSKGPGFWKTLGGIFGIGLADSASRGEFKWLGGNNETSISGTNGAPAAAASAPAGTSSAQLPRGRQEKLQKKATPAPLTDVDLMDCALDEDGTGNSEKKEKEKKVISTIQGMNFEALKKALENDDVVSWQSAIDSAGVIEWTSAYTDLVAVIRHDNTFARDTMKNYIGYLAANEHFMAKRIDGTSKMTVKQVSDHIIAEENKKKQDVKESETIQEWTPSPDVFTMSEGHGFLYLLSRLITKGYIPQLSDHTWSGAKDQTFYKKIWSGMTYYLWDGGPLTNNKDSKNPLVGAWHNGLQEKVAAFTLVHVQDEKSMITAAFEAMKKKSQNIDGKALLEAELLDRKAKVDALENVLKTQPLNEKDFKNALAAYEASVKTKWEIVGNKLGMKWWANGWKIFKWVDGDVYRQKAEWIVSKEKVPVTEADLERIKSDKTLIEIDGKKYQITKIESGNVFYSQVHEDGKLAWNWKMRVNDCIAKINRPIEVARIQSEAIQFGKDIDTKKDAVLSAFDEWNKAPEDAGKKQSAITALKEYNKLVTETNVKAPEKLALLTESEAKALGAKTKVGGWLANFIHTNTTGSQFGWADKVDKWTTDTNYLKWARRGFVWVGLLSIVYNSREWFTDLIKDGKIGSAMTRMLDLGIGMVPFVGAVHDATILFSEDYERWMLGAKMSPEEREMRKLMIALWVIPGVGIVVKWAGNYVKSGAMLATGSTVLKSGNLARSVATYSLLGMSLVHATYDITGNKPTK